MSQSTTGRVDNNCEVLLIDRKIDRRSRQRLRHASSTHFKNELKRRTGLTTVILIVVGCWLAYAAYRGGKRIGSVKGYRVGRRHSRRRRRYR